MQIKFVVDQLSGIDELCVLAPFSTVELASSPGHTGGWSGDEANVELAIMVSL